MKRQHSLPLALVNSLLVAPRARGIDIAKVCDEAGLPEWAFLLQAEPETKTEDEGARFPLEDLGSFLITLWRHMEDESGGFLSQPLKLGTFSMMCHAIISAGNLRRGLLRSARYISLVSDDLNIKLEESGDEARLTFDWSNALDVDDAFFITSMFIIWVRLSCWMVDRPLLLDRVEFQFDKPKYADEFDLMFPCRHVFAQKRNLFAFNRRMLALPIKQDSYSLTDFLNHAPQSLLTQFRADDSVTAQVRRVLSEASAQGNADSWSHTTVTFDDVAEQLGSTTHTLRRRLKEEGHSFQEIKDSLRREKALELLEQGERTIQQISDSLGFSEAAAFNRAFKKWTGKAPSTYRDV